MTNSVSPLDAYLTHLTVERRLAANSIESYARDLNGLAEFAAGRGQSVERLTRQDLEALVRDQMSQGRVVEYGPAAEVFGAPRHEYTRALFEAAPGRHFAFGSA